MTLVVQGMISILKYKHEIHSMIVILSLSTYTLALSIMSRMILLVTIYCVICIYVEIGINYTTTVFLPSE